MRINQIIQSAIKKSVRYLESAPHFEKDCRELTRQKWDGAWWHMAALYEIGEVSRIPKAAMQSGSL
ncbi:hypothetical protein Q5741_04335 [Paenibacillus sp. JX-17]|uniref:Uncharacterized protein n=1 Tax=Paenibacillus lacisoli TaxID=3064525 RepID=A0ABT9CDG2_9BACL|nr:hypothetical protein [Paenibacillus sp. JX-17]MDO7905638.1 hypothetical protein [Paenibacillus sp. JX-17]